MMMMMMMAMTVLARLHPNMMILLVMRVPGKDPGQTFFRRSVWPVVNLWSIMLYFKLSNIQSHADVMPNGVATNITQTIYYINTRNVSLGSLNVMPRRSWETRQRPASEGCVKRRSRELIWKFRSGFERNGRRDPALVNIWLRFSKRPTGRRTFWFSKPRMLFSTTGFRRY